MRILRFSKHLNRTELGKNSTHEGYFYLNKQIRDTVVPYLPGEGKEVTFYGRNIEKTMTTRLTITKNNKEYRLPGLGKFFDDIRLSTEDLIVLEFQEDETTLEKKYFYEIHSAPNSVALLYKTNKGFQVLSNFEKLESLIDLYNNTYFDDHKKISFQKASSEAMRSDAPKETDFYNLLIDDKQFSPEQDGNYLLTIKENDFSIKMYNTWTISEGVY